jgi:hypothetical protein
MSHPSLYATSDIFYQLRNLPAARINLLEKSSPEDRGPCAVFRLFFSSGEALANKLAADFDSGEITT